MGLCLVNSDSDIAKLYNGWSSYETWLVSLNLTNDEKVYRHITNMIYLLPKKEGVSEIQRIYLAVRNTLPDRERLNKISLAMVNWLEIYDNLNK